MSSLMDFCRRFVFLRPHEPISFADRPYLDAVYASHLRNVVLRCSRQVEKSTFLANSILYELAHRPNACICYVAPRDRQSQLFSRLRLLRTIDNSPLLRRRLIGKTKTRPKINDIEFRNGSVLHIRSCFLNADSARGLSLNSLYVDEFQDIAADALPVLQEAMSHDRNARTVIAGTPKLIENQLETIYGLSTQNEWTIACPSCRRNNTLLLANLGATSFVCAGCQHRIDPDRGRWIAKNPGAEWEGFWINHAMVPWIDFGDIQRRQREYDDVRFKNEVLGLPTVLGDHIISLAELEACCGNWPIAQSAQDIRSPENRRLVAGIDWGGGGAAQTAVCIGYFDDSKCFVVVHFARFRGREDPTAVVEAVGAICRRFNVAGIAADAGNGHVFNRLLLEQHRPQFPTTVIRYSAVSAAPVQDGLFHSWNVDRTKSIGHLISRAKSKHIRFPHFLQSKTFLEEIACEVAEFDNERRTIRYTHPANTQDDILHACNYALLQAGRIYEASGARDHDGDYLE